MISSTLARVSLVSVFGLLAAGTAGACAASGGSTFTTHGTGTGGESGSTGGVGGGSSGSTDTGVSISTQSGSTVVGGTGGACAASPYVGQQLPLDMYIMQDQSGSMDDSVASGGTKWAAVTAAFNAFVAQTGTTGISVGIQYFGVPPGSSSCPASCTKDAQCDNCSGGAGTGFCLSGTCLTVGDDSCTASDYAKPDVEIAPLPGVAGAITASLAAHSPSTATPTAPALQGAVDHAKAWAQAHPGHVVVAVLATDGEPSECSPTDQAGISAIAAAALAGTPSIKTFAIGTFAAADMPSGPNLLNAIAAAGGTTAAFNISTGSGNVNQAFLQALNAIRGTSLGCQYTIPTPEAGTADYTKVNVQYTSGGGTTTDIGNVADKAHCPTFGNAWYYDNNSAPTQIELCPTTCTTVTNDTAGTINILLGCTTMQAGAQ